MIRQLRFGLVVLASVLAFSFWSAESRAEEAPEIEAIDLMCVTAIGGGYPGRGGLLLTARLRRTPELAVGLEVGFYAPWGVGANLLIDVYRTERLRVHLFDPGVFYAWNPQLRIVRPDVERDFDITLGLGVEWQFSDRWWLTVDHRFFFANPVRVIGYYGDFARRIYTESAMGVQTWIGVGYSF
ncbi:MAG: hypothetical protein U9Q03_00880 [Patescibacteria group bacterium]|nr:hypothetical protein [Patescibacteria group bacterium]